MIADKHQYPTIQNNGVATHVILPIAEFQRLRDSSPALPTANDIDHAVRNLGGDDWHEAETIVRSMLEQGLAPVRRAHGLTQEQLAELVDLSQPHISRLEKDLDGVTVRLLRRLAVVFHSRAR